MSRCSLCDGDEHAPLFTKKGFSLVACRACGLIRVDPMPDAERIAALYAPPSGYQLHRLRAASRYIRFEERRARELARIVGPAPAPGARLLDVGCASGLFLAKARAGGWQVQGIEMGSHLAAFARAEHGLEVEEGDAEAAAERLAAESFDVVTLWDVVEHVPRPLPLARSLFRVLRPSGRLYAATPNEDGWVARFHWHVLRRAWGIWPHPEPPRHLHQFSRATIARLFDAAGFTSVRIEHDEIPLWYTSGFQGKPRLAQWLRGEERAPRARTIHLLTAPVFLAARLARRGDSMIVCGLRPSVTAR